MDDFVEAVFAGRVVITNVRGLNDEQRVCEVLSDAFPRRTIRTNSFGSTRTPRTGFFDPIVLDLGGLRRVPADRQTQAFWPSEMRQSDWAPFALRGGVEAARIQGRPRDCADAWTRHRHFNWDVVLTTPASNFSTRKSDLSPRPPMCYRQIRFATYITQHINLP